MTNPKYIEDITEGELRAKLMPFYEEQIDVKEKLSPLQLAYVLMSLQENPEAIGSMLVLFSTDSVWKKNEGKSRNPNMPTTLMFFQEPFPLRKISLNFDESKTLYNGKGIIYPYCLIIG